jgi:2'-5' RNA ligase
MRLFVAVALPDDIADALDGFERPREPTVRWTTREQWHVTLRFFGEVDDPGSVVRALHAAAAGLPAVDARIGPRAKVLSRHIVCVPVEGLAPLAHRVVDATRDIGDPPPSRPFRGHVTLARAKGRVRHAPPMELDQTWSVSEIELVRSHLGPRSGARYETLERFFLS